MNIDQILERLSRKFEIVVGFPRDKQIIYPPDDRKGHHNPGGQTVAQVATWNEFGTIKTPSRPFLREALRKNKNKIADLVKKSFSLHNIQDPTYFDKIGLLMVNMVRDSILHGDWIPNSEQTKIKKLKWSTQQKLRNGKDKYKDEIAKEKGQIKPLIDRGIMIKNVNYEVRKS